MHTCNHQPTASLRGQGTWHVSCAWFFWPSKEVHTLTDVLLPPPHSHACSPQYYQVMFPHSRSAVMTMQPASHVHTPLDDIPGMNWIMTLSNIICKFTPCTMLQVPSIYAIVPVPFPFPSLTIILIILFFSHTVAICWKFEAGRSQAQAHH